MRYRSRRPVILCTLLVVLALSAGCLGEGSQAELPDQETVDGSLDSLETMSGTLVTEQLVGNETTELHMEFVQRITTGEFRATVSQESPDVRYRLVSDGSTMWMHNLTSNTVREVQIERLGSQWNQSTESIRNVFSGFQDSEEDADSTISTAPVVPAGGGSAVGSAGVASLPSLGNASLTYQGTTSAVGTDAHVVDLAPASNESIVQNGTLWFDSERFFPVKSEYSLSVAGQPAEVSQEYRNVTYNPEVDAGAFTFEPPANATIESENRSVSTYLSREEMVAQADHDVPEPSLPESYEFTQSSIVTEGETATMSIQYTNGSASLAVAKQMGASADDETDADSEGESIEIAGHDGTLRETGPAKQLSWECEGTEYTVAGSGSVDQLRSIAESIACA